MDWFVFVDGRFILFLFYLRKYIFLFFIRMPMKLTFLVDISKCQLWKNCFCQWKRNELVESWTKKILAISRRILSNRKYTRKDIFRVHFGFREKQFITICRKRHCFAKKEKKKGKKSYWHVWTTHWTLNYLWLKNFAINFAKW